MPQTPPPNGEPESFRRRGRLVFTLLAVLVFIALAPLASVAWKLIDLNREGLRTAQQEFQLLLASSISRETETRVDGLRAQLYRVAQTLGSGLRGNAAVRSSEISAVLDDVVDERLTYLRYHHFQDGDVKTMQAGELPASLEPLFVSGLEEATTVLSESELSQARITILSDPILLQARPHRAVMVVSAPVVSRGRFRGVLSALVDLQNVWDSVVARNRTGHVIFASDSTGHVFASTNPVLAKPAQEVSRSELVRRFIFAEGRSRETMPFFDEEIGTEGYLGSYERSRHGWGIFVQARQSDVYMPVQSMVRSTVTWAVTALVLAVLAASFFARTLSQPIKRLAAASRAFASGDFSTRVAVASRDEIGELAFTYNRMASAIEDQIRRLRRAAEENQELFLGTIRALAAAIDAKDPYTRGHSTRVNRYSVILSQQLGLSDAEIREIHVASLMHDVGKIGIDDHILKKPGKLTDQEFDVMKTHTTLGESIMAPIRRMKSVLPGLRWHHERWQGGGYPDGLEGEKIPLMARIIAVADSFDAMTTHRPYQTAMTFDAAHKRLNDLKGTAFDERIVDAFNRAYTERQIQPSGSPQEAEQLPAVAVGV